MISLKTAGEALTIRLQPRASRTMDQRLRAFVSLTSILLFFPRNFRARSGSRSPHQTVCPRRRSKWASKEPAPPTPSTKMRIGWQLYHNHRAPSSVPGCPLSDCALGFDEGLDAASIGPNPIGVSKWRAHEITPSALFGQNNRLREGVHCFWLAGDASLEAGFHLVAKHAQRVGVARSHAIECGCERRHKNRAEKQNVLGREGLLVSVAFIVVPRGVWEREHFTGLHSQILKAAFVFERSKKFAFSARVSSKSHSRTLFGHDCAVHDHLRKDGIRLVHEIFKSGRPVIGERREHDDESSSLPQFPGTQ